MCNTCSIYHLISGLHTAKPNAKLELVINQSNAHHNSSERWEGTGIRGLKSMQIHLVVIETFPQEPQMSAS